MATAISFDHVAKRYRARDASDAESTALHDVSFDIAAGEFVSLVGPSGCGKSTLLDLLGGLTPPSEGTVSVNGFPVQGPGLDRGIVFQQYALLPWRTAAGNIEFGLEAKGVGRHERRERAHDYLDLVGLSDWAGHYPHELSGGMKQRVALARSLAFDPDVLLMDEPFAALDAQTREVLQDELLTIWRRTGKTVLFVTHGVDEAVYLGQRVIVLGGRPGTVHTTIDVDLGDRFTVDDLRSTPDFGHYRHEVWQALRPERLDVNGAPQAARRSLAASGV